MCAKGKGDIVLIRKSRMSPFVIPWQGFAVEPQQLPGLSCGPQFRQVKSPEARQVIDLVKWRLGGSEAEPRP